MSGPGSTRSGTTGTGGARNAGTRAAPVCPRRQRAMETATAQARATLGQTGQPPARNPAPRTTQPPPLPRNQPGVFDRIGDAVEHAAARFQSNMTRDLAQEFQRDVAIASKIPAATALTYEHKINVVKTDISLFGNGVTLEKGRRWSISYRGDGTVQTGMKTYGSAAGTITFPKTKIIGGGPYIEGKVELAGTGDVSFKGIAPYLNSANIDGRLIGKGAGGVQGSLLGQSAKLYVQAQGGARLGTGYNRPFDLAPDTMGTYVVGEAGNHVVKLKVPFVEMMQIHPQAVATRITFKAAWRAGEAIGGIWQDLTRPPATAPVTAPAPAPQWQPPACPKKPVATPYTVQKGDTLWDIARSHSGGNWSYIDLAKANADRVANPDLIFPGQQLRFPER